MGKIIQFPKTRRAAEFYRFLVRWSDGAVFAGDTIEECFRKQKDFFEPECSMLEYLERFRRRLEVVDNTFYDYKDIRGLVRVLVDKGYLEVLTFDEDTGRFNTKFS